MGHREDYWHDALGEALEAQGLFDAIPSDARRAIGDKLARAAEWYTEYSGDAPVDRAPDPMIAVKKTHASELMAAEHREQLLLDALKSATGHDVLIQDGVVSIRTGDGTCW